MSVIESIQVCSCLVDFDGVVVRERPDLCFILAAKC